MNRRLILSLSVAALAGGCVSTPPSGDSSRWAYFDSEDGRPTARYGVAESEAFLVLECMPSERAIAFRTVESELFDGARPFSITVGRIRFDGEERLEPGDGIAIARSLVPADHPLVAALAAGQGPILFGGAGTEGRVPNGRDLARMLRACRASQ